MRCKILGILASAVGVVILYQVFKNSGVEIEFLLENMLKTHTYQFVDDGFGKGIPLAAVTNVFGNAVEEYHFGTAICFYRENIVVGNGNVQQGIVKEFGKITFVLSAE